MIENTFPFSDLVYLKMIIFLELVIIAILFGMMKGLKRIEDKIIRLLYDENKEIDNND